MLIEFRVANHRSIRDEQALSMTAANLGDPDDPRPRAIDGSADKLLPVAALYGANASGKSNVLSALAFMRNAVVASQRMWGPDEGIPRDPFAWGTLRAEPSKFEIEFIQDGVRYRYGFSVTDEIVQEEWLHAWPNGHKQTWFTRDSQEFHFSPSLQGDNKAIEAATRPNALFLSTAVQLQHKQLTPVYNWFRHMEEVNIQSSRSLRLRFSQSSHELAMAKLIERQSADVQRSLPFAEKMEADFYERFCALMQRADIGVLDFRVVRSDAEEDRGRFPRVQFRHQADEDDAWLPLEQESRGTRTLFHAALPILRAIDAGAVLLIDELEASLHPLIAQQIVRQFNDPATNPRHAQLIFTTHDTNLLGTTLGDPVVRRDEVWLTEKNPQGGTVLYPLTDFQPRKAENLERGYLQGRYSAVPYLGEFSLAPE